MPTVDRGSDQTACTVHHPLLPEVVCSIEEHPHRVAHFASGLTEAGVHWNTIWWSEADVQADPAGSANHPLPL